MMYSVSCNLQLHDTAVLLIAVEKCGAEALASRAFTRLLPLFITLVRVWLLLMDMLMDMSMRRHA